MEKEFVSRVEIAEMCPDRGEFRLEVGEMSKLPGMITTVDEAVDCASQGAPLLACNSSEILVKSNFGGDGANEGSPDS